MRFTILCSALLLFFLSGCNKISEKEESHFSIATGGEGKMIRLNTKTGETCIVGETCDSDLTGLVVGETYIYRGNGMFEKPDYTGWSIKKVN